MIDKTCFNWVQLVKKSSGLEANSKYIALYLATFMNAEHDMAWPSLTRIADETGLSRPTIVKHINFLVDAGWLIKSKHLTTSGKGGTQQFNCYRMDIPTKVVKLLDLPK